MKSKIIIISDDNIKLSIIIYIKNLIQNHITSKKFSNAFLKELLKDLIDLIMTQYFNDLFIKNTIPLITLIMNYFSNESKEMLILDDFVLFLISILDFHLNQNMDNQFKLRPLISIYSSIFVSKLINSDYDPFHIFEKLFQSISTILQNILLKFKQLNLDKDFQSFLL